VPPDGWAVNWIVCPLLIVGALGVIVTVSGEALTVTVAVALAVSGKYALSVTATQYFAVAVNVGVV
jgi:hypothetical protein